MILQVFADAVELACSSWLFRAEAMSTCLHAKSTKLTCMACIYVHVMHVACAPHSNFVSQLKAGILQLGHGCKIHFSHGGHQG